MDLKKGNMGSVSYWEKGFREKGNRINKKI